MDMSDRVVRQQISAKVAEITGTLYCCACHKHRVTKLFSKPPVKGRRTCDDCRARIKARQKACMVPAKLEPSTSIPSPRFRMLPR